MSLQELSERQHLHEIITLYLKETLNNFTLDKIKYNNKVLLYKRGYENINYPNATIIFKDKYSNVKFKTSGSNIYEWGKWRMDKYMKARGVYLIKNPNIHSINATNFSIDDKDISAETFKTISTVCQRKRK